MAEIEVFADTTQLIRAEAERIAMLASEAIEARGRFLMCLSGGHTPKPLYELLASPPYAEWLDWTRIHLFWGDERCVPPNHPDSNYRMTREALISRVPIRPENVHRIRGEDEPDEAADEYERVLHDFFGPEDVPLRSFDLALLGMGPDGHTASIFPGTPATREERRWAMPVHVERLRNSWRVTLLPIVLNAAADVTFLVAGRDKAPRIRELLGEDRERRSFLPAGLVKPKSGTLHWMLDAAAVAELRSI